MVVTIVITLEREQNKKLQYIRSYTRMGRVIDAFEFQCFIEQ